MLQLHFHVLLSVNTLWALTYVFTREVCDLGHTYCFDIFGLSQALVFSACWLASFCGHCGFHFSMQRKEPSDICHETYWAQYLKCLNVFDLLLTGRSSFVESIWSWWQQVWQLITEAVGDVPLDRLIQDGGATVLGFSIIRCRRNQQ